VKISDDRFGHSQFLPSISVDDKTGQIVVFFYDTRADAKDVLTNVMATMSSDGGATWTPNVQLNAGQSTHANGTPPPGFKDIDYGDYTSVAINDGAFFPVWADNSTGLGSNPNRPKFDLATNRVTVAQVADAPIRLTKRNFTAARYRLANPLVATFTDDNPFGQLSDFSALINWGDGTPITKGVVTLSGGVYRVKGFHTYTTLSPSRTATVVVKDIGGSQAAANLVATIIDPPPTPIAAVGTDAGAAPFVQVLDPRFGNVIATITAYDPAFRGGVRVAVADINQDGFLDVITAPGPGSGAFAQVRVFDGISFALFQSANGIFSPYGEAFTGGIYLATGDVNGDQTPDIVVGPGPGARQRVQVFNGNDAALLTKFFGYDANFVGGVRVAAGDVNGDGKAEVITAPGPGLVRAVRVWNPLAGTLLGAEVFAFGSTFNGGMNVSTGDFNGDHKADIVIGANNSAAVKIFRGSDRALLKSFTPFAAAFRGGVRVAAFDADADGVDELIAGPGAGGALPLRLPKNSPNDEFFDVLPFGSKYASGMFVAAANL
jgi:hypothetical protein